MIDFYYASMRRLDSGLYVAYLKMRNSVDCVRVMVNREMPGSLPCTKVRSVANVSRYMNFFHVYLMLIFNYRDEWEWLHKNSMNDNNQSETESSSNVVDLSLFKKQFQEAARELCLMLSKFLSLRDKHLCNCRRND